MKAHVVWGALVILLLLVGCGRPPARVAPGLDVQPPSTWSTRTDSLSERSHTWWTAFDDGPLTALVEEALAQNHDLGAALARVEAALGQARIAGADGLPQVNAGLSATRERRSLIGIPLPPGREPTLTTNRVGVSLDTTWEIDLWGRVRSAKGAALAEMQATWADAHAVQLSIAGQTAKAYFSLVEAEQQLRLAEETVQIFRISADRVRDRFDRGLRSSLDVRLSLSNLAGAEALWAQRRIEQDLAVRQLEILLGRYPAARLVAPDALPAMPAGVPAGLPGELLLQRPDVFAAERRLAAAGARVGEARRAFLPRLSLNGSAGSAGERFADLADGNFFVWNLASNLVQPLFQGGRLRAGLDVAHAGADQAMAVYAQTLLRGWFEAETALASEVNLDAQTRAQAEAALQAKAAQRLAEDRYRNGLENYVTVLEAQRRGLEAQGQLLRVRRQQLDARVNLYLALGGGFDHATETAPGSYRLAPEAKDTP